MDNLIPNIPNIPNFQNTINIEFVPKYEKEELERKLKDMELRKKILEEQHAQTLLTIQTHINTEKFLREENNILKNQILELNNKISGLEDQILQMRDEMTKNANLLKINQCVYLYKDKIWKAIFKEKYNKKKREFGNDKLLDILKGEYDSKLTTENIENIKVIVNNITTNFEIEYLFNSFQVFTNERNQLSHPTIKPDEFDYLKYQFLNYCNTIWDDDIEENEKFTSYIFDVIKS